MFRMRDMSQQAPKKPQVGEVVRDSVGNEGVVESVGMKYINVKWTKPPIGNQLVKISAVHVVPKELTQPAPPVLTPDEEFGE